MLERRQDLDDSVRAATGRVLVVDDDEEIAILVAEVLRDAGYAVDVCTRSREALELVRGATYDLCILDVMMPALDGISLCLDLRHETDVPIVFLSARAEVPDRIIGLRAGADDYLAKPFSNDELVARVGRILTRSHPELNERQQRFGRLVIDGASRQAVLGDDVVALTPTEFKLLRTLAQHPGRVFTRDDLLTRVWNYSPGGDTRLVDVHVGRLRKKLEDAAVEDVRIETARGFGYRLVSADLAR